MKIKKCICTILSITILLGMSVPSMAAGKAPLVSVDSSSLSLKTTDTKGDDLIIYETNEIKDINQLIQRAKQGIDEFSENENANFDVYCNGNISNVAFSNSTSEISKIIPEAVIVYKTSQYLGKTLNNQGELEDVYALTGITTYSDKIANDTQSNGGCTITTTVYCAWGNTSISELRFLRSESKTSGTLMPTSLQMHNSVYHGYTTNQSYFNSRNVNYPSSGIYTLGAAFYGYISDYGSYISATDILNFGSGGSLSTRVSVSPYGY